MNTQASYNLEIVLIDNFDSFTYNLVNQLLSLVNNILVYRNDVPIEEIQQLLDDKTVARIVVLSPGPGSPKDAGICLKLLDRYKGKIPFLGICLGHQAIIENFGGVIGPAKSIVHGKACDIALDQSQSDIFGELPSPFRAARYHSLAAIEMPKDLQVIATADDEVMAIRHNQYKLLGFQFHPESILTPRGAELLSNALAWLTNKIDETE